jgi:uncharacterized protein YndB with AHSA1/START domain
MSTTSYDWSRFMVRININAPVDKLYKAWITREGIEYWFLRFSEFKKSDGTLRGNKEPVEKGDTYKWRWHGYPDSVTEQGTILEINGKDFFKFSFGKAGICSVTIKQEQGETIVEMLQENIPADEHGMQYYHVGCKNGWTFHFTNMKSIFEGGLDLRNKNEQLQEVINS